MRKKLEPCLADLPFPVDSLHDPPDLAELRRKERHDKRAGAERHRLENKGFGLVDAHIAGPLAKLVTEFPLFRKEGSGEIFMLGGLEVSSSYNMAKKIPLIPPLQKGERKNGASGRKLPGSILLLFLFNAGEDLALFAVHFLERDAVLVLVADEMQDPVTKTVVELFFKRMPVFFGLRLDRRKAKRDIPEKIDIFTGKDFRGNRCFFEMARDPTFAECKHIGRPRVPEIAAVEFAHLGIIHQDHAQHRFFKTQVLQDLRGDLFENDLGNPDLRAILFQVDLIGHGRTSQKTGYPANNFGEINKTFNTLSH